MEGIFALILFLDQSEGVGLPRAAYLIPGRGGLGGRWRRNVRFRRRFRRRRFRRSRRRFRRRSSRVGRARGARDPPWVPWAHGPWVLEAHGSPEAQALGPQGP